MDFAFVQLAIAHIYCRLRLPAFIITRCAAGVNIAQKYSPGTVTAERFGAVCISFGGGVCSGDFDERFAVVCQVDLSRLFGRI